MNPALLIMTTIGSETVNETAKNITLSPNTVQAMEDLAFECMNISGLLSFSSGLTVGCSIAFIFILLSAYTKTNKRQERTKK